MGLFYCQKRGEITMLRKLFKKKQVTSVLIAVLTAALGATTVFAAAETGVPVTGTTLSGGSINFGSFSDITLHGTQETAAATWTIGNIIDARGTGAGWNLSLTLTPLKEYNGSYVVGGKVLAMGSVKITTAPIVTLADATSSAANTITPVTTTTSLDTGSPIKLISAMLAGGMGSYAISSLGATLTTPASVYAKTYKTNATVTLSTGP
jgi:hypothetical protein